MLAEIIGANEFKPLVLPQKSPFSLTFEFSDACEKLYYVACACFVGESRLLAFIADHSLLAERIRLVDEVSVSLSRLNNSRVCAFGRPEILGRLDEHCAINTEEIIKSACSALKKAASFDVKDMIVVTIELNQIRFEKNEEEKKSFLVT